jgi:hypothetical protein
MKVYIDEDTLAVLLEFAEGVAESIKQDGTAVPPDLVAAIAEARRLLRVDD